MIQTRGVKGIIILGIKKGSSYRSFLIDWSCSYRYREVFHDFFGNTAEMKMALFFEKSVGQRILFASIPIPPGSAS